MTPVTPAPARTAVLALPEARRRELALHAVRAWPREACGILLGVRPDPPAAARVFEVVAAANVTADSPRDTFEIDPGALVAAHLRAERAGLDVVGFWHSHPDRPAVPSARDRRAAWPGVDHVIVPVTACAAGRAAESAGPLRAWRFDRAEAHEVELVCERGTP